MKFEIHDTANGQFYWRVVASNGEVLAHSETYVHKADAESAIRRVQIGAATAKVVDLTRAALAAATRRILGR